MKYLLFLFLCGQNSKLNNLTVCDSLDINESGIHNISINANILNIKDLKSLKYYDKKEKYLFPEGNLSIYFLSIQENYLKNDFSGVEDLFVITDLENRIKTITIFLDAELEDIINLLSKKFGRWTYSTESTFSNVKHNLKYIWITKSGIEFCLESRFLPETNEESISIMVYNSNDIGDYLGEWKINR